MPDSGFPYNPGEKQLAVFIDPLEKFLLSNHCRKNLGVVRLTFAFGISLKITTVWRKHRAATEVTGAS